MSLSFLLVCDLNKEWQQIFFSIISGIEHISEFLWGEWARYTKTVTKPGVKWGGR